MPVDDSQQTQPHVESSCEDLARELTGLYNGFIEAYEAGDAAALVSRYTEDAALIEPDKPPIRGRDNIAAHLREWFQRFRFSRGRWAIWELEHLGDTAWDLSYFELDATRLETGKVFREQWKQLCIWKRRADGAWRLHRLMFNSHRESASHDHA